MPYREGDPTVLIEASIEVTTAKAYLIHPTMGKLRDVWLPKSQTVSIEDQGAGENKLITVTEWWFNQAGLDENGG